MTFYKPLTPAFRIAAAVTAFTSGFRADTQAQTQPKKRHFKNPAQYIGSRKKRKKIVRDK